MHSLNAFPKFYTITGNGKREKDDDTQDKFTLFS